MSPDSRPGIMRESWCRWTPSVNDSERRREVCGVVIHYTGGGGGAAAARWLQTNESGKSYHCIGFRNGDGVQLVDFHRKAWHAGRSRWQGTNHVNSSTIGIALANHGKLERVDGKFYFKAGGQLIPYVGVEPVQAVHELPCGRREDGWWEPYTDAQMAWLRRVLRWLRITGWPSDRVVGHDLIALPPGRKLDPGPLFDWEALGAR